MTPDRIEYAAYTGPARVKRECCVCCPKGAHRCGTLRSCKHSPRPKRVAYGERVETR